MATTVKEVHEFIDAIEIPPLFEDSFKDYVGDDDLEYITPLENLGIDTENSKVEFHFCGVNEISIRTHGGEIAHFSGFTAGIFIEAWMNR